MNKYVNEGRVEERSAEPGGVAYEFYQQLTLLVRNNLVGLLQLDGSGSSFHRLNRCLTSCIAFCVQPLINTVVICWAVSGEGTLERSCS